MAPVAVLQTEDGQSFNRLTTSFFFLLRIQNHPLLLCLFPAPSSQSHHRYDDSAPKAPYFFFFLPLILVEYEPQGIPATEVAAVAAAKEAFLIREREGETSDSSSSRARIQNALLNRGKTWHAIPLRGGSDGKSGLECVQPAVSIKVPRSANIIPIILMHSM